MCHWQQFFILFFTVDGAVGAGCQKAVDMRGLAPHWTIQTVEWSRKVATVHSELRDRISHIVLPNLPGVITDDLEREFYQATTPPTRIATVVAAQHTQGTLEEWMHKHSHTSDTLLVVGGNSKTSSSLSSLSSAQAIETLKRVSPASQQVWAVANPNDRTSVDGVVEKIDAGATGIITQPLLSSHAMQVLEVYPHHDSSIMYLAGMALPKTVKSLYFWLNLLEQSELIDDVLFCDHVTHFSARRDSLAWCRHELSNLAKDAKVDGIHYMPVNNTADLLSLFSEG